MHAQLELIMGGVLQVWRPLAGPVTESPLAMLSAASVDKDDLVPVRIDLPDGRGMPHQYIYMVKHNPGVSRAALTLLPVQLADTLAS